jgi:hypothetical protein
VRGYVVRNLTVRAAAEQLAEQYAVDLPPSYEQAVSSLREEIEASFRQDRVEQALEVDSTGPYVSAVELEVGGILLAQAGQAGGDAEKQARGEEALQEWMSEHPADINPRYGISVTDANLERPKFVDTTTSYALTPNAVDAAKINTDEGPDQAQTATLPRSQRCG